MAAQQTPPSSIRGVSSGYKSSLEYNARQMKGVFMPGQSPYDLSSGSRSQTSSMMGDGGEQRENHPLVGGSMDGVDEKQV